MSIVPIYGHDALRSRLASAIVRGTLPSSLLLHGKRGVGKQRLALWLAQALVCASPQPDGSPCGRCQACRFASALGHPDIHWFFPRPRLETDAGMSCQPMVTRVTARTYSKVDLRCDTGIR